MRIGYLERVKRNDLAYAWLLMAILALTISGLFSFLIALARTPLLSDLFSDPTFFRRALVVHVDLGVSVWFTAFPVAIFHLLNRQKKVEGPCKVAWSVSAAGVLLLIFSGFSDVGQPYMNNYIPIVSHPLFLFGLVLYFTGVAFNYLSAALLNPVQDDDRSPLFKGLFAAQMGIKVGALYLLATIATIVVSWAICPDGLSGTNRYEMMMWGGGHVLQLSNVAFMLVCWTFLLSSWMGESPITRRQAFAVFAWLGLPLLLIPYVAAQDISGQAHREGFSMMMKWGIFPPVLLYLGFAGPKVARALRECGWGDARFLSFVLSAALILVGFVFGAFVRGPDLRLPGHYHASIGAVTLSFMGAAYVLLMRFGRMAESELRGRRAQWQAFLTGVGQLLFSAGMFVAGSYGMARKLYGTEQQIKHVGQSVGMWIMGFGGVMALLGGILFVTVAIAGIRRFRPVSASASIDPLARQT